VTTPDEGILRIKANMPKDLWLPILLSGCGSLKPKIRRSDNHANVQNDAHLADCRVQKVFSTSYASIAKVVFKVIL